MTLETDRFILRHWQDTDADALFKTPAVNSIASIFMAAANAL